MARLFGTDGVRGIANTELTPELSFRLGWAAAYYFGREHANPCFMIGRDTRVSGQMLEAALAASRQKPQTPTPTKVGPNDPCPCGSGKKYKHCHRNK